MASVCLVRRQRARIEAVVLMNAELRTLHAWKLVAVFQEGAEPCVWTEFDAIEAIEFIRGNVAMRDVAEFQRDESPRHR
jgi:hypothetical protein